MLVHFRRGLRDLGPIWRLMFSDGTMKALTSLSTLPDQRVRIGDELWTAVAYETALSAHRRIMPREHLLRSLTPLYWGRTAAFVLETDGLTSAEAESRNEGLCLAFEKHKPWLVKRWSSAGARLSASSP